MCAFFAGVSLSPPPSVCVFVGSLWLGQKSDESVKGVFKKEQNSPKPESGEV